MSPCALPQIWMLVSTTLKLSRSGEKPLHKKELTGEHRQDQGWEEEVKGPSAAPAVVLGYIPLEKKQWQGMGVNILW